MGALIYLADDDPGLLEVFSAFLENAGFDVRSFPTGDELAAQFALHEPDLVVLDVELSEMAHEARAAGTAVQLTMTEFVLLRCLLKARGGAVSRDELLSKVWGFNVEVETRVTDETVRRVRKKLRDAGSATQIKAVWGYGYKLEAGS